MDYIKSAAYNTPEIMGRIMGPNPVKLTEELLLSSRIPAGATVLDLGCGQGVTSLFLAKEYGFTVFATDLWIAPTDNMRFFARMGLTNKQIVPIHAEAHELPYAEDFFDAAVCVDSYHYFGREASYLDEKLAPLVKPGGYIYIAVPGMWRDLHDALPEPLLLSWTPEDLDTIHDIPYWRAILAQSKKTELLELYALEGNEELWADWLTCDNAYAKGDRKSMDAGGGQYLNFIGMVLQRR